jgi:hypothetical protein
MLEMIYKIWCITDAFFAQLILYDDVNLDNNNMVDDDMDDDDIDYYDDDYYADDDGLE